MSTPLASRVQQIKPSPTIALSTRAKELQAQGRDIINLSVGEPDFETPSCIKHFAIKAIHDGATRYTAVGGTTELKKAIIHKLKRDNQFNCTASQIIASTGAKQVLYNLCQALLQAGDEVIIPAPYWVSYPAMVTLSGAVAKFINADISQQFKITAEQLAAAITPQTKLFILNSPNNPTGIRYSHDELLALGNVLQQHPQVLIVSDEIYEYVHWDDSPHLSILNVCPELAERTVVVNGVSKAYAMTGWRLGYAAGPETVIAAMQKIQSQSTSNPCSITQAAASAALGLTRNELSYMYNAYRERHEFVFNSLSALPGFSVTPAQGTFYIFPDVSALFKNSEKYHDDITFADYLLNEMDIAVVPGSAFGLPNCIRLSYATGMDQLKTAMQRLQEIVTV